MRTSLLTALSFLVAGCAEGEPPEDGATTERVADAEVQEAAKSGKSSDQWVKLVMHPFHNAQGVVTVKMPLPSTWEVNSRHQVGEPTIVGPHGVKVIDFPAQNFLYTSDPRMQMVYRQSGQPLRPMPGVERLVQEDLVPWCSSQGLEFVKLYEIPEVTRIDQWYNDQLYKVDSTPSRARAIGTEWKHSSGKPFFMIIHLVSSEGSGLQTWYYWCSGLQADPEHFETARKQLLFGLANAHYNPEPILAYNRQEAERVGRSWAEHNQRMAANQAAFEASQRAFVNRSSAINESIMQGWRERNAASDRSHERFVDTITERTKVADTTTGQHYKVDSGANHYWMNQDGRYIGTDNADYNPNLDDVLNSQSWQQLEKVD
jgi:hypothetical protein